jgi:hypothetical protein
MVSLAPVSFAAAPAPEIQPLEGGLPVLRGAPRPADVSGSLLVAALRFLSHTQGRDRLRDVYAALPRADQHRLATVRLHEWYPLAAWERFLGAADAVLADGDLALIEPLGRGAAERVLGVLAGRMVTPPPIPSPYTFLARSLRRWRSDTCSAGSWVMTCDSPHGANARLHDLEVSPTFEQFLCGWLAGHLVPRAGRAWSAERTGPGIFLLEPLPRA